MVRIYGVTTKPSSGGTNNGGGNVPSLSLLGITQYSSSVRLTTTGNGIETSSNIIVIPSNSTALLTIQIVAKTETIPKKSASWNILGSIKRGESLDSVSIVGFSPVSAISDNELQNISIQLSENTGFGGLSIICTGIYEYTVIKWAATVTLTEV